MENILKGKSNGKKKTQSNIHSMFQIWRNKQKEKNPHMHREKYTIVYIVSVISGWLVFLLLYFSPFSKFSTISVFLLYLRKTYFKTRHAGWVRPEMQTIQIIYLTSIKIWYNLLLPFLRNNIKWQIPVSLFSNHWLQSDCFCGVTNLKYNKQHLYYLLSWAFQKISQFLIFQGYLNCIIFCEFLKAVTCTFWMVIHSRVIQYLNKRN